MPRLDALLDLRVVNLKEQAQLPSDRIPHFRDLITGTADLDEGLRLNLWLLRRLSRQLRRIVRVMCVARRSSCEVRLMLLALGVREVRAFVGVKGQAQSTFDSAKVVAQDIGVLRDEARQLASLPVTYSRNSPLPGQSSRGQVSAIAPSGRWPSRPPAQLHRLRISTQHGSRSVVYCQRQSERAREGGEGRTW